MSQTIHIKCIEVTQPIGTFLIGSIDSEDLTRIAYADIRRVKGRDIETYIGIQRDLSSGRVAEIKKYVSTVDACFPTSIILAIDSINSATGMQWASYDATSGVLTLENNENLAKIIDGQHRIAGLEDYRGPKFQLNVTIFMDMDLEDQAMVFATINLKQTKVGKSLAYDLYEFAKRRSPQKTSHNIAKLLNFKQGSPLQGRIKILGKAGTGEMEVITQATFVDRLLNHISKDAMQDKDLLKRDKKIEFNNKMDENLIFRKMFIEEKDAEIAKCLWNYFEAVAKRWPTAWNDTARGMVLARTTGFSALMRLLPRAYRLISQDSLVPSVDNFYDRFLRVEIQDSDFTSDRFKPGSSGESELYKAFQPGFEA